MKVTLTFKYFTRVNKTQKVPFPSGSRLDLPAQLTIDCISDLQVDFEADVAFRGYVTNHGLTLPPNLVVEFTSTPQDPSSST